MKDNNKYNEKDYNLLIPSVVTVQINPFFRKVNTEITVNTDEGAGEVFEAGKAKIEKNGKSQYEMVYALAKPFLMKLATAACIQFDPNNTTSIKENENTYVGRACGAVRIADGSFKTHTDTKRICLDDEEASCRIKYIDNAMFGIFNYYAAKEASEKFKGTFVGTENFRSDPRTGEKYQETKFVIDESDRQKYVDRSVMVYMAQLRKTASEKAQTGAVLRVIRALLGIKGAYTKAELKKPFVVQTVTFLPDYNDPFVKKAMIQQGLMSMNNLFGTASLGPIRTIESGPLEGSLLREDEIEDPSIRIDMPGIDSAYDDDFDGVQQEEKKQPEPQNTNNAANQSNDFGRQNSTSEQAGKISPWDIKVPDDAYSAYDEYKGKTLREAAKTAGAENLFHYLKEEYSGDERVKKAATVILDYVEQKKK